MFNKFNGKQTQNMNMDTGTGTWSLAAIFPLMLMQNLKVNIKQFHGLVADMLQLKHQ